MSTEAKTPLPIEMLIDKPSGDEWRPTVLIIAEEGSIVSKPDYVEVIEYKPGTPMPHVVSSELI